VLGPDGGKGFSLGQSGPNSRNKDNLPAQRAKYLYVHVCVCARESDPALHKAYIIQSANKLNIM